MITQTQLQELHQIMKRSELITTLANAELTNDHIFTDAELKRATTETFINNLITRKEIDFKKICLSDTILSGLKKERDQLLDKMKDNKDEETKQELQASILHFVGKCDDRYDTLCNWYGHK
jgi:predicted transcriptional regulator